MALTQRGRAWYDGAAGGRDGGWALPQATGQEEETMVQTAIRLTTKVLPGKRIEVTAPELVEGDDVEGARVVG